MGARTRRFFRRYRFHLVVGLVFLAFAVAVVFLFRGAVEVSSRERAATTGVEQAVKRQGWTPTGTYRLGEGGIYNRAISGQVIIGKCTFDVVAPITDGRGYNVEFIEVLFPLESRLRRVPLDEVTWDYVLAHQGEFGTSHCFEGIPLRTP
jgi:hypothetical protein